MSSPTVADQLVYVTASHGIVAAFSVADGTLKWRYVFGPSSQNDARGRCSPMLPPRRLLRTGAAGADGRRRDALLYTRPRPDTSPPGMLLHDAGQRHENVRRRPRSSCPRRSMTWAAEWTSAARFCCSTASRWSLLPISATGTVSYTTPLGDDKGGAVKPLKDGVHLITLRVKDYAGNQLIKEWSFTVDSTLPPPRRVTKPPVGKTTKEPGAANNTITITPITADRAVGQSRAVGSAHLLRPARRRYAGTAQ